VCAAQRAAEAEAAKAAAAAPEGEEGGAAAAAAEADPMEAAVVRIQAASRGFVARRRVAKVEAGTMDTAAAVAGPPTAAAAEKERAAAAARIQALARGKADRAYVKKMEVHQANADGRLAALTHADEAAAESGADKKAAMAAAEAAMAAAAASALGAVDFEAAAAGGGAAGAGEDAAEWAGRAAFVKDLAGVRIGVPRARYYEGLDPALAAVVEGALSRLSKAGAVLVEVDFPAGEAHPMDLAPDVIGPVLGYEAPRELSSYLFTHTAAPPPAPTPAEGEEEEPAEDVSVAATGEKGGC
jgi:hypothetical protein